MLAPLVVTIAHQEDLNSVIVSQVRRPCSCGRACESSTAAGYAKVSLRYEVAGREVRLITRLENQSQLYHMADLGSPNADRLGGTGGRNSLLRPVTGGDGKDLGNCRKVERRGVLWAWFEGLVGPDEQGGYCGGKQASLGEYGA